MFENRVLREIFGTKSDEMIGEYRRLHNEDLYGLYFSSNVIRVISSRTMRWAGHVARTGDRRGAYSILGRGDDRESVADDRFSGRTSLHGVSYLVMKPAALTLTQNTSHVMKCAGSTIVPLHCSK